MKVIEGVVVEFINNNKASYVPGEVIRGNVKFTVVKDVEIKGIILKFKGEAEVQFTDGDRQSGKRHHHAEEVYFNKELVLFGSNRKHGECSNVVLYSGEYDFPFEFELPTSIPPTFSTYHGFIRYFIRLKVDMPKWQSDFRQEVPFTVLSDLDLNCDEEFMQPYEVEETKTMGCLCCSTGSVSAKLRLDRRGYAYGDKITVFADIHNNSRSRIRKTKISLCKLRVISTTSSCEFDQQDIFKYDHGEIPPGMSDSWNGEQFPVFTSPPSLLGCKIIEVKYTFELSVKLEGCLYRLCEICNLNISVPIIIGAIPLHAEPESKLTRKNHEHLDMNEISLHCEPQIVTKQPQPLPSYLPSYSTSFHVETSV